MSNEVREPIDGHGYAQERLFATLVYAYQPLGNGRRSQQQAASHLSLTPATSSFEQKNLQTFHRREVRPGPCRHSLEASAKQPELSLEHSDFGAQRIRFTRKTHPSQGAIDGPAPRSSDGGVRQADDEDHGGGDLPRPRLGQRCRATQPRGIHTCLTMR